MRKTSSGNAIPWVDLLEDLLANDWIEVITAQTCVDKVKERV
jgi:hypothetical protein